MSLISLDQLYDVVVQQPLSDSRVTATKLQQIWKALCMQLEESLLGTKGVNIQDFGVFSFVLQTPNAVTQEKRKNLSLIFTLAGNFQKTYNVRSTQKIAALIANVPISQLNPSRIAQEVDLNRDQVTVAIRSLIRQIGETVKLGNKLLADFGFGKLTIGSDRYEFRSNPNFNLRFQEGNISTTISIPKVESRPQTGPKDKVSTTGRQRNNAPNILSLNNSLGEIKRPDAPSEKYRSFRSEKLSASLETSEQVFARRKPDTKHNTHSSSAEEEICELCRYKDNRDNLKKTSQTDTEALDRQLKQMLESKDAESFKTDQSREEEIRRQRKEIEEYNLANSKKGKSIITSISSLDRLPSTPTQDGHIMQSRKAGTPDSVKKKRYYDSLKAQMNEKQKNESEELALQRKIELDLLNQSLSSHAQYVAKQQEDKLRMQQENKDYLLGQMASKGPVAQLGASEVQFMSKRLVSTAELKQRQKTDAKTRMSVLTEVIESKGKIKDKERKEEEIWGAEQKKESEKKIKEQELMEAAKKAKIRAELSSALEQQIKQKEREKQQQREEFKSRVPYYDVGSVDHVHSKQCKQCGRQLHTLSTKARGFSSLRMSGKY